MNELFMKFAEKNGIDIESLGETLTIYNENDINSIIANYKLEGKQEKTTVSVAEIIGYNYSRKSETNNLARNFELFFSYDSTYQMRSIGMLKYTSDNIMEKLSNSFTEEPICVLELDERRKIISHNGLHRYTVLRLHFLNEMLKAKGDEKKQKAIVDKYKIPVKLSRVDLLKTYCNYLIKRLYPGKISVWVHYDENNERTGNTEISTGDTKIVLTDDELINYTKELIKNIDIYSIEWFLYYIDADSKKYPSFKAFMDMYFGEEITFLRNNIGKIGRWG